MPVHVSNITDKDSQAIKITDRRLWIVTVDEEGNEVKVASNMEGGGKIAVGTTAVEVVFIGTTKTITISADKDNTGTLYIGKSDVTSTGLNAFKVLEVNDSIELDYDDSANPLYVVASIASQNFWKGALTQ